MSMDLIYKDKKDITYSVDVKTYPGGKVNMLFSCDGGKFGTDELVDEYEFTVKELLSILRKHDIEEESFVCSHPPKRTYLIDGIYHCEICGGKWK